MKRCFALLCAVVMIFSMSTVSYAMEGLDEFIETWTGALAEVQDYWNLFMEHLDPTSKDDEEEIAIIEYMNSIFDGTFLDKCVEFAEHLEYVINNTEHVLSGNATEEEVALLQKAIDEIGALGEFLGYEN